MDNFLFQGPGICFGYIDTDDEESLKKITPQMLGLPATVTLTNEQKVQYMQNLMKQQYRQMQSYMQYSENMPEAQKNQIKQMMRQMAEQIMKQENPNLQLPENK